MPLLVYSRRRRRLQAPALLVYSRRRRRQGPAAAGDAAMAPAVADAEAESTVRRGRQLVISPAAPDIVRKPARASGTTAADGSCCTALCSEGLASASAPLHAQEHSQSAIPEDLDQVDCDPAVGTQESTTVSQLVGESSGKVAQQEQQQEEEEEGVASDSDADAASPAYSPTREKLESRPRRWRKKSTKGVQRLKVAKDKVMKPKVTTPSRVKKKKKKMPEDGNQHVGAASPNSARRKLDLDSSESESETCFSRAKLMGDFKCITKIHGLNSEPTMHKRSMRGKKRNVMVGHKESGQLALVPYQRTPTVAASFALEPLWYSTELDIPRPRNHGKRQAKVLGLTDETLRVFDVLTKWYRSDSDSFEGFDIGRGPEWDAERRKFEQYVDRFIAEMSNLVGPRKYSQWGGSLVDSVVGTFLTQNSADHLSSQAFMTLAAKFPPRKRCYKPNATPLLVANEAFDIDSIDSHFDGNVDYEEEADYDTEVEEHYGEDEEYNRLIGDFAASMKQKNISTWDSDLMNLVKDKSGSPVCSEKYLKRILASIQQPDTASYWKELWEEAYKNGYNDRSRTETSDVVDWESVLNAPFSEVAKCIAVRGQHNILALRIREFLDHVQKAQDGSFDLDWLRFISCEKANIIEHSTA